MLKYLHIENIAVIEQSNIDFTNGFNALTGETGAGKSIVIDAINAVLGERTSKELIRYGCERATVCAQFDKLSLSTKKILEDNALSADENGELYITRVLSADKKGSIRINGQPVTAAVLREIAKTLINIHGQHDNQNLFNPEKHLEYIDRLANNTDLLKIYTDEFNNFKNIRKQLLALDMDEDEKLRRIDYLKYKIDELTKAEIKSGELAGLKGKIEIAKGFEKTVQTLNRALALVSGGEDADGMRDKAVICQKLLTSCGVKEFEKDAADIEEILYKLEDIGNHISSFCDNTDYSTENLNNMLQRLDLLQSLMLKYGDSEEKLLLSLEDAKAELANIEFSDERAQELEAALEKSQEALIQKAQALTLSRKKTAESFEKSVCETLSYLDMPKVKFCVNFSQGKYTKNGCDNVEFYISANAGELPKPLIKIASGGELSRVMLAIQNVLLNTDDVPTLIFDEIDSGISGRAADKVGVLLKRVAMTHQVICVTHLAQIAANAHTHFLIEKSVNNGRTFTNLECLDYEGRIKEISRIMSGLDMTENMYNSAKELLDRRQTNENL